MDNASRVRSRRPKRVRGIVTRGGRGAGVPDLIPASQQSVQRDSQHPQSDDLVPVNIEDFPVGQPLETPLSSPRNRKRPRISFVECGGSSTTTPATTPPTTPPSTPPCLVRPRQPLRGSQKELSLNYGSESDDNSGDSEEEDVLAIPSTLRIHRTFQDTPEDEDIDDIPLIPSPAAAPSSSAAVLGPLSFTDFEWKSFPNPQISPDLRREAFSENNVGPTTPCVDPYDTFIAIWDRQIMEHIASETNRYAQQEAEQMFQSGNLHPTSRIAAWVDTTVDELYLFFALTMAMGIIVNSDVREYWSTDIFGTPGLSAHMSHRRFQLLSKCLHFNNNENLSALERQSSEAKLFKIQPVVSHLNCKFQSLYNLSRNIAIDKSLLQCKGLFNIKQFITKIDASEGIKMYELCESTTGYLWRFAFHARKEFQDPVSTNPLDRFTTAIVLKLIHGLENKGHTLWMDNYFNSPLLARKLKTMGFDCVGTLRANRQFVPDLSMAKLMMTPGQVTGLTSGDVDILVWKDKNVVTTISTYHGNGVARSGEAIIPEIIRDYNIAMGGVDKKDQMLDKFPMERKRAKVWYKKLFRRLLNVSILNSYILYKKSISSTSSSKSPLDHRSFRKSLVKSLMKHHSSTPVVPTQKPQVSPSMNSAKHHYPAKYSATKRIRRNCVVCRTRVSTYCIGCDRPVCIFNSCFRSLHSKG